MKLNEVRLLIVAILWEYQARPVTGVCDRGGPALLLALFSAAEKNPLLLLRLSSLSTQTALPDKQFLGSTCILMILMSFISSLGASVAIFSIFAVAVVIFWSTVE